MAVERERLLRDVIAAEVMRRAELRGYVTWGELEALPLPSGETMRVIDGGGGGIWNPQSFMATLSIVTSPDGPYADREKDGLLSYHYQAGPVGGKNVKLRRAMELGLPVIRFDKVGVGAYNPIYPVFVVADDQQAREFSIALDIRFTSLLGDYAPTEIERQYTERVVRQRVHQPTFRAQVMLAYQTRCTVCVLKKAPLLDAAHIIGDGEERGSAVVTNGLSLCKIHHAAYDQNLMGITPDYTVAINRELLEETDGPMLLHGLQEMNGRKIALPSVRAQRPDRERLAQRYDEFLSAS